MTYNLSASADKLPQVISIHRSQDNFSQARQDVPEDLSYQMAGDANISELDRVTPDASQVSASMGVILNLLQQTMSSLSFLAGA